MRIFSLTLNNFIEEKQFGAYQQVFRSRDNHENAILLNELHILGRAGIILAFLKNSKKQLNNGSKGKGYEGNSRGDTRKGGTMNGSINLQSKDATQDSDSIREKRKHPRFYLDLLIEFRVMNAPHVRGAMIVNASETGLLIQSPNNVPAGTKLNIAVLFSKGFELANFEVLAEVVWTKTHLDEGRQGYELGLKFIQILEEDRQKLKHLIGGP